MANRLKFVPSQHASFILVLRQRQGITEANACNIRTGVQSFSTKQFWLFLLFKIMIFCVIFLKSASTKPIVSAQRQVFHFGNNSTTISSDQSKYWNSADSFCIDKISRRIGSWSGDLLQSLGFVFWKCKRGLQG